MDNANNKEKLNSWKKFRITEKLVNSLLILILGFLIGVAVKTEAKKRLTIGYDDYTVSQMKQGFDLMEKIPTPAEQAVDSGNEQSEDDTQQAPPENAQQAPTSPSQ